MRTSIFLKEKQNWIGIRTVSIRLASKLDWVIKYFSKKAKKNQTEFGIRTVKHEQWICGIYLSEHSQIIWCHILIKFRIDINVYFGIYFGLSLLKTIIALNYKKQASLLLITVKNSNRKETLNKLLTEQIKIQLANNFVAA